MRRTSRTCLMLRRSMCVAPNSRKMANLSCAHSIRHRISWLKRFLALWRSGAGVVELVDARHSKCRSERSVGSIPTARTIIQTSQNSPGLGLGSCLSGVNCTERASPPNLRNDSRTPVMLANRIPDGIRPSLKPNIRRRDRRSGSLPFTNKIEQSLESPNFMQFGTN
jgi:hypothetical protein